MDVEKLYPLGDQTFALKTERSDMAFSTVLWHFMTVRERNFKR